MTLRTFVDRSVIETYVDDRVAVTSRVYPEHADSTGAAGLTDGGVAAIDIDAWELEAVWPVNDS